MIFKRGLKKIEILVFLIVFFVPLFSFAQTIHSTEKGGDWNNPNTWEEGIVPGENNDVIINSNTKIPKDVEVNILILTPNTSSNKYRILTNNKVKLKLNDPGDYYFRGDLDLDYFEFGNNINIYLDDNRIFVVDYFCSNNKINFINKNNIILKNKTCAWNRGIKIEALKSDIFFKDNINTDFIKAKNIYLLNGAEVNFSKGEVFSDNIIIQENAILTLGSGAWHSQEHIDIKSNIVNYGELIFNTINIFNGDIFNYNLISQNNNDRFKLKGDLYNYLNGIIDKSFIILPKTDSTKILNQGIISKIRILEDVEFHPETTFNFYLDCNNKNIILTGDSKFNEIFRKCNFQSKNGDILNLELNQSLTVADWSDFNLIVDNPNFLDWTFTKESNFNKLIIDQNSHLNIYGQPRSPYYSYSYINGDVINNGEVDFKTNYNSLKSYFHKSIQNNGVLLGKTAWAFPDKRNFKYLISENEILTDTEKEELDNSSLVDKTINLVPKLSEIDKEWYLHIKEENAVEIRVENLNHGLSEPNTNFETNSNLPSNPIIPDEPEPGDRTAPVVSLNGNQNIELILGKEYVEKGATAFDDVDGDLTNQIEISGNVDVNTIGTYTITYSVSDLAGNTGTKIRTIVVKNPDEISPVVTLNGDEIVNLKAGETYTELGATAIDETDGDLTNQIQIDGEVDTEHTGIYEVRYSVSDSAGNEAKVVRTVKVSEGNSSVGLPDSNDSSGEEERRSEEKGEEKLQKKKEIREIKGHSGVVHRSKTRGGKIIYACKDSKAVNFSSIGKHKQELCVYNLGGVFNNEDTIPQGKKEEENREEVKKASEAQSSTQFGLFKKDEFFKKNKDELEKQKEKELSAAEKEKYILISTCLKLKSKEKSIRKYSKDREAIKKLQSFLKEKGYLKGKVDGAFGAITKSSLLQFQKDNKLYSDGILGKGTIKWIDRNCRYIKNREYFVKEEENPDGVSDNKDTTPQGLPSGIKKNIPQGKEKKQEKKKQKEDFASQNPPKKEKKRKFNIGKKEHIISKEILEFQKNIKEIQEETKKNLNYQNSKIDWIDKNMHSDDWFENINRKVAGVELKLAGEVVKGGQWVGNKSIETWHKTKKTVYNWFVDEDKIFYLEPFYTSTSKIQADPNKETIIVIHGLWSDSGKNWVQQIAGSFSEKNYDVLLFDWGDITDKRDFWDVPNDIDEASKKIKKQLIDWKINPNKTTIIGHSYGSLMASVLASKLGGVKEVVALDPAASLSGTEYNISQSKEFPGFNYSLSHTKCFVGTASAFGSENKTKKCNEQIYVDFKNVYASDKKITKNITSYFAEHSDVHKIYRDILRNNTLYDRILSPWNPKRVKEGEIEVDENKIMEYLLITNGKKKIFYGSEVDNEFKCTNSKTDVLSDFYVKDGQICEFYGWKGDDGYEVDKKSNNFEIKDFIKNIIFDKETKDKKIITSKDKIIIDNNSVFATKDGNNTKLSIWYGSKVKTILLKNTDVEKVKEWIKVAKLNPETDIYYDKKEKKFYIGKDLIDKKARNSIQIKE